MYSQSTSIARYAAKLAGLYPTDPLLALRVDMITDTITELYEQVVDFGYHEKDEAVKAEKSKRFLEKTLPRTFTVLEGLVQGKFFLGDTSSLADIHAFEFIESKVSATFPSFCLDDFPRLAGVVANVQKMPGIAAYREKRCIRMK